jgi:hypothetical protein
MKTNSPNPVDGDVQALIEQCKDNIDTLIVALKHCEQDEAVEIHQNLELQKVALAALTAEPVYQFIVNNPDKDGYIEWADCNPDYFSNEPSDSRRILYTTPPDQLLLPVELPPLILFGYTEEEMNVMCNVRNADIEAIRAAGYEVKS